ncbi:MAG: hemerythrin domain-containing protein [Streptosporangiaceae bacterium]
MKTMHDVPGAGELRAATAAPGGPPLTLAEEHALLLEQVAVRAEDVLTVAAGNRWPARELQRLLGYVRAEVLRQAGDEEMLLFIPRGASPGLARLCRDHARLRDATEMLERIAAGEAAWSPARVATVTRDLVCQLERHLAAEERLLTVGGAQGRYQAVSSLGGHPHEWYPLTEGPVIDLDALPPGQVIDAVTDRLLRLGRGEQLELCSGRDPWLAWRQMDDVSPGGYGFAYLEDGPDLWRVQVTRRPDPSDTR